MTELTESRNQQSLSDDGCSFMREPAQLVVSAILRELRPLRDGVSQDEAKSRVDACLREVKKKMAVLDRLSVMKNRNSARQIRKTIQRLQYQIRTAPRVVQNCGYVQQTFPDGSVFFVPGMLSLMDEALDKLATFSASVDYTKALCASHAYSIVVACSKKPPASSSENSPFRVIASLIYQHCTGKRQDLERACEDTLRRGGGWTWDDPIPQALFDNMVQEFRAWLHARPDLNLGTPQAPGRAPDKPTPTALEMARQLAKRATVETRSSKAIVEEMKRILTTFFFGEEWSEKRLGQIFSILGPVRSLVADEDADDFGKDLRAIFISTKSP